MKLTKKDFFDGQEMTEREREIYKAGIKEGKSPFLSALFVGFALGIGLMLFIANIILIYLKHQQ